MEKLVTFIIAAYNSEKYIKKCLNSFLILDESGGLCEKRFEVLVVNDGSTDRTEEIALQYQKSYQEIFRVITKVNGGHGSVINCAVKEALGKYLKVVDADDWIEKNSLSDYLDGLAQTNADVVLTHYKTFDIKTKEVIWWKTFLEDYKKKYTLSDIQKDWKSMDRCLTFHGITYRTEFYKKRGTRLTEKVFYEDHQYATIPCCYAASIQPFDCCLYIYRIGDSKQSVADRNQYLRRNHIRTVILAMCNYFNKNQIQIEEAGQAYYREKLSRLILSYLVIVLLGSSIRSKGRKEAKQLLNRIKREDKKIYQKIRIRYVVLLGCSYGKITVRQYKKILENQFYNWIRRNKNFKKEKTD